MYDRSMPSDLKSLELRALELVRAGDFGPEATRVNAEILELSPRQESALTRLGRCHLEQRKFDDAVVALRAALSLNPSNAIATNLLTEVRRRRALTPTAAEHATTGFSKREFTILETLSAQEAARSLGGRIESLLDAVNTTAVAQRIVETRLKRGESGSKLFRANSYYPGGPGQIVAFHQGGRWEPQFSLGWFASPAAPDVCFRVGLGFNLAAASRDRDGDQRQEQVLRFFDRFQRVVGTSWKRELARWMAANAGFIQYGDKPPAVDLLPDQAVEWLLNCRNAAVLEWVFCGRWLFLDKDDDARILADRSRLVKVVDDTFRTLFPIWLSTYTGTG